MEKNNKLYTIGWNIAIKNKNEKKYHVLKNNIGSWVADPFLVEKDNQLYIFGEMYEYRCHKGSICYSKYDGKYFSRWKKIIDEPYHISFPNIEIDNKKMYMYPESSASNEFYRYKCIEFPNIWKKEKVYLNNVQICDTVFFTSEEKKYGLTYDIKNEANLLELFEFNDKDEILSQKKKIITDDLRIARPGGKVIYNGKEKIRVAQDCSDFYGKSLNFLKFDIINNQYKEKIVKKMTIDDIEIDSKFKFHGLHTYNTSKNYEVIDVKFRKILLSNIFWKIINKIRKLVKKNV